MSGPLTNAAAAWEAARAIFDRASAADHESAEMATFRVADTQEAYDAARAALRASPTREAYNEAARTEMEAREDLRRAIREAGF